MVAMPDNPSKSTPEFVREFYERIWNAGDHDAPRELLAPNFIFRGSLGPEMRGREAFCEYANSVRSALDNYRCDILDCVTEGQRAFAKMRFSGIHVGQFRGFAPTGKSVNWLGAALFRIQGPLIAELWVLGDLFSLEADLKKNAAG
jgi:predicted ester cyclase